jgi:hypothetical protein
VERAEDMTVPSFIVYLVCRKKSLSGSKGVPEDAELGLDVVFDSGGSKEQPERYVSVFSDYWDVDIGKLGKADFEKMIEASILKSETVSREYPVRVRAWNDAGFLSNEGWKWKILVKWKGRRV